MNAPFQHINAGNVMLDNAAKFRNKDMVAVLLKYGADPNLLSKYHKADFEALSS